MQFQLVPISMVNLNTNTYTTETNTVNNINNTDINRVNENDHLIGTLVNGSRFQHMGNFNQGFQEFRLMNLQGMQMGAPEMMMRRPPVQDMINGGDIRQQQPAMVGWNGHSINPVYQQVNTDFYI